MPNRIIHSNKPQNAKVQVYGSDLTTPLEISNGLLMVELPGTPTVVVGNTVSVTGTVQLAGTPTVVVGNTVSVTGAVQIVGSPTVIIGSQAFTSILITSFAFSPTASAARSITTQAIDVSQISGHSYAVHVETSGLGGVQIMTPRVQAAPINVNSYFTDTVAGTDFNIPIGTSVFNQILNEDNNYLQYSRFVMDVATSLNAGGGTIAVTVYFQGNT